MGNLEDELNFDENTLRIMIWNHLLNSSDYRNVPAGKIKTDTEEAIAHVKEIFELGVYNGLFKVGMSYLNLRRRN